MFIFQAPFPVYMTYVFIFLYMSRTYIIKRRLGLSPNVIELLVIPGGLFMLLVAILFFSFYLFAIVLPGIA